ncbi:MAG: hypothetical protein U0104_08210 [Gemmatimonadales bacterium]
MTAGLAGARRPGGLGLPGRLFLTVALVYAIHFAPNVVRETYLAIALGESASVRVDRYLGLHPDLFEIPGRGAYINNNPGVSLLAAVPYAVASPAIEGLLRAVPSLAAPKPPATYEDPRPNRTRFMNEMRARGLDVKLGLAAAAIHLLFNVPVGAAAAVLVFLFLRARLRDERTALWLALLFALGTPVFFRSAFLNQNLALAYCTLAAYLALAWHGGETTIDRLLPRGRVRWAGFALGLGLLCDYSAAPLLLAFGLWLVGTGWRRGGAGLGIRQGADFTLGAAGPIAALLAYQAVAFGSPWFPAQRYMPATELSTDGWNGLQVPTFDLLWRNLLDPRYGLIVSCPMLLAALLAPRYRGRTGGVGGAELVLLLGASLALYLFCSAVSFAALQWNTGVRYLVPAVPLLFVALVPVLLHLPRGVTWLLVVPTVTIAWAMAMTRENIFTALLRVFTLGPELPWHTVLQKTAMAYLPALAKGGTPLMVLLLTGVVLWLLWRDAAFAPAGDA